MPPAKKSKTAIKLTYWPVQGRVEPVRLALTLAGQTWEDLFVSDEEYANKPNAGTAEQPFGQWPVFVGEDGVVVQMDAILRYVGRKYLKHNSLTATQAILVDELISGAESIRSKYSKLIWVEQCTPEAIAAFFKAHVDPATTKSKCDGAHFGLINGFLERAPADKHLWIAQTKEPTIADATVFNVVDVVRRLSPDQFDAAWPKLATHRGMFLNIPEIKTYVTTKRFKNVNDDNEIGNGIDTDGTTGGAAATSSSSSGSAA